MGIVVAAVVEGVIAVVLGVVDFSDFSGSSMSSSRSSSSSSSSQRKRIFVMRIGSCFVALTRNWFSLFAMLLLSARAAVTICYLAIGLVVIACRPEHWASTS